MMGLRIPYESEDFPPNTFPPNTVQNGKAELSVTWDDILWAAVTVGRPGWFYVFQHGISSGYEALFRWSLIRMALEKRSPRTRRLTRTDAAKALDPTEKGMVSYFLGMTFCKVFSTTLLNTPWVFHLDLLRLELGRVLNGRSRPDLIGLENGLKRWHGFECKGRSSQPDSKVKNKAKTQAGRLGTVDFEGISRALLVAAITYFRNDVLQFYWCDPPPEGHEEIVLDLPDEAWRHYYGPVAEIISPLDSEEMTEARALIHAEDTEEEEDIYGNLLVPIGQCDLKIGVHRAIESHLFAQEWGQARNAAIHAAVEISEEGFQADGLRVRAGESWHEKYQEPFQFEDHGET